MRFYKHSMPIEKSKPPPPVLHSVDLLPEIPVNASAQRKAADAIQIAEKKIYEFEQIYNITSDSQIRDDMYQKVETLQNEIKSNKNKIIKLKKMLNTSKAAKKRN